VLVDQLKSTYVSLLYGITYISLSSIGNKHEFVESLITHDVPDFPVTKDFDGTK